jgi:hypothetical protein
VEKDFGRCAIFAGSMRGTGVVSSKVTPSLIVLSVRPLSLLLRRLDKDVLLLRFSLCSEALSLIIDWRKEFRRPARVPLFVGCAPSTGLSGATLFRGDGDLELGNHDRRRNLDVSDDDTGDEGRSVNSSLSAECTSFFDALVSLPLSEVAFVVASFGSPFLSTVDFAFSALFSLRISKGGDGSESGVDEPELSELLSSTKLSGSRFSTEKVPLEGEIAARSMKESWIAGKYE